MSENKNFEFTGDQCTDNLILTLLDFSRYFIIETEFTINHIERYRSIDRGKIKWIAETSLDAFALMDHNEKAAKAYIDNQDCFPRFYFLSESFGAEFNEWRKSKEQSVAKIFIPGEYNSTFDDECYEFVKNISAISQ